ncbi:hypothetical protein ACFFX0_23335 [Citricoccus parietis]|uniref:Uncharacterized protein n=1 Tax=Citricoccus parietis TaxID=592307 RepID=A0ABV5G4W0_9MICC
MRGDAQPGFLLLLGADAYVAQGALACVHHASTACRTARMSSRWYICLLPSSSSMAMRSP